MRFAILSLLSVFVLSCKNNNQQPYTSNRMTTAVSDKKQNLKKPLTIKLKKLSEFMSDTVEYIWSAKQSDSGNYWIQVIFKNEYAVYQFHGQCIYWFFTDYYYTGTDKIELLWSYKTDCLLDMGFLEKGNGIKKRPKSGDAFCEYRLVNDSVIVVKYKFSQWVAKINEMEKDSIFPTYFYLQKKDGI